MMMFKINLGDGRLGNVEIADGLLNNLNAYARVTAVRDNVLTIDNISPGKFNGFDAGENILLHVAATNGTDASALGRFFIATITLVDGNKLTIDKNVFDIDLNFYYLQIISIPQFKNLFINNATIAPPPFDVVNFTGGILALQVFDKLQLNNSNFDLSDAGIPYQKKMTYRPLTEIEMFGETDGSKFAKLENLQTADFLLLNSGDGAVFIQAHNFTADKNSRIGNPDTHGRKNCRGAADSPFKPSNTTNIGGSSILIAAHNFDAPFELLAKYRNADSPVGRGLARCLIAADSILPDDDNLYAFDIIHNLNHVQNLGVQSFGDGSLGNFTNPHFAFNNFAQVSNVVDNKFFINNKTLNGIATFKRGSLIIIRNIDTADFKLARILDVDDNFIVADNTLAGNLELISVPEFNSINIYENLTFNRFCALACADTFNLQANINVVNFNPINIGNAQSFNKTQAIFILAKNFTAAENSRLAAPSLIITETFNPYDDFLFDSHNNFVYQF